MMYFTLCFLALAMNAGAQNPTADMTTMSFEEIEQFIENMPDEYAATDAEKEEIYRYMYSFFPGNMPTYAPLKRIRSTSTPPTETDFEWEDAIELFSRLEALRVKTPAPQPVTTQTPSPEPQRVKIPVQSWKPQYGTPAPLPVKITQSPEPRPMKTTEQSSKTPAPQTVKTQTSPEPQYLETLKPSPSPDYEVPQPPSPEPEVITQQLEDCCGRERDHYATLVGSIRGVPGIHFPDYDDIPITSFTCSGKRFIPGFYADLETGCQVFHVCWPHRRESFLCPVGTIFNQAILACDYWYSSNCSLAPHYYEANAVTSTDGKEIISASNIGLMIDELTAKVRPHATAHKPESSPSTVEISTPVEAKPIPAHPIIPSWQPTELDLSSILKLFPVKAKVVVYPESKIVAEASVGSKQKHIPETEPDKSREQKQKLHAYASSRPSVGRIVDEILEAAKKILEEAEKFVPHVVALEKVHKPQLAYKPKLVPEEPQPVRTLTKLIPRFITKPAPTAKKPVHTPAPLTKLIPGS